MMKMTEWISGNAKDATIERTKDTQESGSANIALYTKADLIGQVQEASKIKYQRCQTMHLLKIKNPSADVRLIG